MATSAVITAMILLFGRYLMDIFTDTPELVDLSYNMMKILAVGYITVEVMMSLTGVMRGAGDTVTPMWISILNNVLIRVPLAYLLVHLTKSPELPNGDSTCMFISLVSTWVLGAVVSLVMFRLGHWKKKALA
jgi:Na+-driven multidrug efflux pump